MVLVLAPQAHLSPLEVLLTIYTPILECLVNHLPTPSKIALSQSSKYVRQLLYEYPLFFSHLDFRLPVMENPSFDSYRLGTVYNLDRLLATLPIENRITSLTLDWTAVTGLFLFGKIMDRCQNTLEHLSVRGCRKVSIKHHIVPYLVYQDSVEPLSVSTLVSPRRALKSLYVYKARGVRRKPFLIDRKPADGDEPSRYLTTLADKLGIWVDLGLCPTPKLRCPRRREILRRGKEKFCVPFDKRWRVLQDLGPSNPATPQLTLLSPHEHAQRRRFEESQGSGIACDNCDAAIPDRCEACVQQMTCSNCTKALCHHCAYARPVSPSSSSSAESDESVTNPLLQQLPQTMQPFIPIPGMTTLNSNAATAPIPIPGATAANTSETNPTMHLLQACCDSVTATNPADILCSTCMTSIPWAVCDGCQRQLCMKHEVDRCRKCEGGCQKIFCFSNDSTSSIPGCGESVTGRAGMKDCLSCGKDVCSDCRTRTLTSSPSMTNAASSDDGTESEELEEETPPRKTSCDCKACKQNYYCTSCWPTKPTPCERRPKEILDHKPIEGGATVYLVTFYDSEERQKKKWMTGQRIIDDFPNTGGPELINAFEESLQVSKPMDLLVSPPPPMTTPESSIHGDDTRAGEEEEDEEEIQVGDNEWIMERVLGKRSQELGDPGMEASDSNYYLIKWLGRGDEVTWEPKSTFPEKSRERMMMDRFDRDGPDRPTRGGEDGGAVGGEHREERTEGVLGGPLI